MSKPVSKMAEPSIDEMLSSIREAIHEETAREAEEHARTFKTRSEPRKHEPEFRRADVPSPPPPSAPVPRAAPIPRTAPELGSSPKPAPAPEPRATGVSGSMRELRVSLQPADQTHQRGTVTARSEDFLSLRNKLASLRQTPSKPATAAPSKPTTDTSIADVMGGDVKLEDALARVDPAKQIERQQAPSEPRFVAPEPPQMARPAPATNKPIVESQMRAAIDEVPGDHADIDYMPGQEAPAADVSEPVVEIVEPVTPVEPVAAAEPATPESDFVPPQMIADPEVLEYTEVAGDTQTSRPQQSAQPVQTIEAPLPAVEQPATPSEPIQPIQQQVAPTPAASPGRAEAAPMISDETAQAAGSAFDTLSKEIITETSDAELVLEESARNMIRPILKKWLDDNLPTLVERLVKEEIERVARKGGR